MKKFLLIALLLQFALISSAQDTFRWGVRGGVNFSNFNSISGISPDYYTGFYGGLLMEFRINKFMNISPELVYSKEGYKQKEYLEYNNPSYNYTSSTYPGSTSFTYVFDHLIIPVNLRFNVYKGLNLYLGPQVGFNLGMKQKRENYEDKKINSKDFKTLTFGFNTGISYDYEFMFVDFRYNLGLTDIYEKEKSRNQVFQLGIGVKF